MERINLVFAGGGTGGHLYPAIAIAQALGERARVTFIGSADRLERTIVPQSGFPLVTVRSRPFARKPSLDLLKTLGANVSGTVQSLQALRAAQPDLVIATGGYVCFPVVVAARILRALRLSHARIALLEPNARPGLTNRLVAPLVDEVWGATAHPDRRFANKYVQTGIPVRASLRALPTRDDAIARLGLSPARRTLLAFGASQGARSINDAVVSLLATGGLPAGWQLVHVTGEQEYDRVRALAEKQGCARDEGVVRPYLHDMADAYAAADLVLSRSGASTLGELAATGKPAVLVPYPHAAQDHQRANAAEAAALGGAIVLEDRELAAGRLRGVLAEVTLPARLAALQRAAEVARSLDPLTTILARVDALVARKNLA